MKNIIRFMTIFCIINILRVYADEDAKRLNKALFSNYNKIVRPVEKSSDAVKLYLGLKLSQIADIDEKNQIMTTNVWVKHEWYDNKLRWNISQYGNIKKINIPSSFIWLPDIVLYNNANGSYEIVTKAKATVYYDGKIIWEPPMIYKSYCAINIEYYPFDIQQCYLKLGSWTHGGQMIELEHINVKHATKEANFDFNVKSLIPQKIYTVDPGIDMSDYSPSVEWDVLSVSAQKNTKNYQCCPDPYYDIYFNITIRRKPLFYTVNLIIPCVNISFLSVLVFFLPSDSGEKLTLSISILVALLVFYLLLIELIPPSSIVVPLIGKYLVFTLILVNVSILLTIFVMNMHHRKPYTHKMSKWTRYIFIEVLPKILRIQRSSDLIEADATEEKKPNNLLLINRFKYNENYYRKKYPPSIVTALESIKYLNKQMFIKERLKKEMDDWKYASTVIDRLLLLIFSSAFFIGTIWFYLAASSIYDERIPLERSKSLSNCNQFN